MEPYRIYCSGPLFNAEEVGGMSAIARMLEAAGFATFLPHKDGLEAYVLRMADMPTPKPLAGIRRRIGRAIFSLDVFELLERCAAVVCNLNGRVPDEGMIVEASLAYAAGRPLVLFKDDVRAPFSGYDNSMLTSLVKGRIINNIKDIPAAVREALSRGTARSPLCGELMEALAYGRRISSVLERLPREAGKKRWSEEVLSRVMEEALKAQ
jgi:nucleoside 2-deoxyribosyltransferase